MNPDQEPVPQEIIEYFTKLRAEQEFLKRAGIHINYVKPIIFRDRKVWALGSTVYAGRPPNETFHTFLLEILKTTIGQEWWQEQLNLPLEKRHFIALCYVKLGEWIQRNEDTAERIGDGSSLMV